MSNFNEQSLFDLIEKVKTSNQVPEVVFFGSQKAIDNIKLNIPNLENYGKIVIEDLLDEGKFYIFKK